MPPMELPKPPDGPDAWFGSRARHTHYSKPHGGSWKVAYADFVTALMCLFIVLWLTNSTQKVKESVAGYFHDPRGYVSKLGAGPANSGEGLRVSANNAADIKDLLEQAMRQIPDFDTLAANVKM